MIDINRFALSALLLVPFQDIGAAAEPAQSAAPSAQGSEQGVSWSPQNRQALDHALAGRNRHGLDRVAFAPGNGSADSYAKAALAYAGALARGVVDPSAQHEVYTLARPDPALSAGLSRALRDGRLEQWLDSLAPQTQAYRALSAAYVDAASRAGEAARPPLELSGTLRVGDERPGVAQLADQLRAQGYLDPSTTGTRYTQAMADAVTALQRDRGIAADGIVGPDTLKALNLRNEDRVRMLAVAMERRRWLSRTPPGTRIDVNTAAATLRYYRDGALVDERRVIVGAPGKETPPLGSPIYRLVANPTWTVPKSIENGELAHVGQDYLNAHNMVRRGGWIVQQPGPDNALGLVKFDMKNDQAIYLHDTSSPQLFDRSERHLSHGCVRVQDALGFADMLAEQDGVTQAWQEARNSGEQTFVPLKRQIPVRLLYHNVFVEADNSVKFRIDPYGWNTPVAEALGFAAGSDAKAQPGPVDVGP